MNHEDYRDWDAAYVLGSLDADERREFERHLATCETCRLAVTDLAGMPGMLSRLDVETAIEIAAEPAMLPTGAHVASAARRIRRRRRIVFAGASAALVVVLAGGVAIGVVNPFAATASSVAMQPVHQSDVVGANITVSGLRWGTRFDWSCEYAASADSPSTTAEQFALVVTTNDGVAHTVATWSEVGSEAGKLSASTAIARDDIRTVDIRYVDSSDPLVSTAL